MHLFAKQFLVAAGLKTKAEGISFQIQSFKASVGALTMHTQKRDLFSSLVQIYSLERKKMVSKKQHLWHKKPHELLECKPQCVPTASAAQSAR